MYAWLLSSQSTRQDEWGSDAHCPDRCDELAAAAAKSASQAMEGSRVRQARAGEGRRVEGGSTPCDPMQETFVIILTSCHTALQPSDIWYIDAN